MSKDLVVKVDGEVLPQAAIDFELGRLLQFYKEHGMGEAQVREQLPLLRKRAIEQAIGARLLVKEAARLDIAVSDAEVEERFNQLVEQAGGVDAVNDLLKQQGLDVEHFRRELRQGRKVDKLVEQSATGVAEPTEQDILEHFEQHQGEYSRGERVLAQHILIKPEDNSESARELTRQKLQDIKERVESGKAVFGDEAALHSECPSGKEGGSLGWFGRGMMVPEFDEAAFAMPIETVSNVIETQFGFHIIYKSAEELAEEANFDDVREQIRDFLRHARRGEAVEAFVQELRSKAQIEVTGA